MSFPRIPLPALNALPRLSLLNRRHFSETGTRRGIDRNGRDQFTIEEGERNSHSPIPSSKSPLQEKTNKEEHDTTTTKRTPTDQEQSLPDELNALMLAVNVHRPTPIPRHPLVLCHGLYGFDTWTPPVPLVGNRPSLELHYWSELLAVLRHRLGVVVYVPRVPATGSIASRAQALHAFMLQQEKLRGKECNLLAHSMGGLDCRFLLSTLRPTEYDPRSLTTIATPHHGSQFMDWLAHNIGLGASPEQSALNPSSAGASEGSPESKDRRGKASALASSILALFDSPAYSNLTTHYAEKVFNPANPNRPDVAYFSIAARKRLSFAHPLYIPQLLIDAATGPGSRGNDGLVSVESAQCGHFLGMVENADHWQMRGARGFPRPDPKAAPNSSWLEMNTLLKRWLTVPGLETALSDSVLSSLAKFVPAKATLANLLTREEKEKEGAATKVDCPDLEQLFAAICTKLHAEGL